MRILVANWQDRENPQAGGAEIHLHEVFGRLARRGHEVTLLVSRWPGAAQQATVDGLTVHRVGGRHTFSLAAPRYYRRHLRGQHDALIEDLNKVPLFAPLWATEPVGLLVHHLFGATAFQEANFPMAAATWLLERPLHRVFAKQQVLAVSQSTAADLVARGFEQSQIRVVENGVDTEHYRPDPGTPRFDAPTVLYLGRLKRYKRIDLIVRAFAEVARTRPNARLIIAGTGDAERELRALVADLRLNERVTLTGFVAEPEKLRLLRGAWAHALTSPKEGWGIANLEAAACGTPTVASDSPGLRDSVRDGETGFLVPHGDVARTSERIGQILDDADLRERLGQGARRFAERFTWVRAADGVEQFVTAVAQSRKR